MEYFLVGLGVLWVGWSATGLVLNGVAHRRRLRLDQAWLLVAEGRNDDARAEFWELARSKQGYLADCGRHGLAWLDLVDGNYAAASETFDALRASPHFRADWRLSFFSEAMAICAALAGDTDTADARLDEATHTTHLTAKATALVACKRGDHDAALVIDPGETADDHDSRAYRLLLAFALDARGDAGVEELVHSAALDFPGEFDYLTRDWPELRAFVERHPPPAPPADLPRARVVPRRIPLERR